MTQGFSRTTRRLLPVLAGGLALSSAPAFATHQGIELRTFAPGGQIGSAIRQQLDSGQTLPANGSADALVAGPPLSPKQSCDGCHDYETITAAYHFQLGLDERVDVDGDGFADELGQVLAGHDGPLETLPTLYNINSPGQFGAW